MAGTAPDVNGGLVTIDGLSYRISELSDVARQNIVNIQVVERQINELQAQLAIANAAKLYYGAQLKSALDGVKPAVQPLKS